MSLSVIYLSVKLPNNSFLSGKSYSDDSYNHLENISIKSCFCTFDAIWTFIDISFGCQIYSVWNLNILSSSSWKKRIGHFPCFIRMQYNRILRQLPQFRSYSKYLKSMAPFWQSARVSSRMSSAVVIWIFF